jgi:hypothetical protein
LTKECVNLKMKFKDIQAITGFQINKETVIKNEKLMEVRCL